VRTYQAGDSLKQLAWRQIARLDLEYGGQLLTKQFSGGSASEVTIDFNHLPAQLDTRNKIIPHV